MQNQFDLPEPASDRDAPTWDTPISVTQFNAMARQLVERNIPLLWIAGEISNFTRAASGHCYFSLKDERAQIRCVMFRSRLQHIDWEISNGMQVEVRGAATVYEARGEFQLTIEFMRRAGFGALFEKFARLKAKLELAGWFATSRKKPLPAFARRIGVVTSPAAAALRDVLTTLRRRMPSIPVVVYPAPVQGEGAAKRLAYAIGTASRRSECDVLILCRGGGSIEDLWAFNEELLARAIFECSVPLVCGVGHETDFTIADFVADARAPTPTAAAELVTPNRAELRERIGAVQRRLQRATQRRLERHMQHVDYLSRRVTHPGERIAARQVHLQQLGARLTRCAARAVEQQRYRVERLQERLHGAMPDLPRAQADVQRLRARLVRAMDRNLAQRAALFARVQAQIDALSPQAVLERGYSIITSADGRIVRTSDGVQVGEEVALNFARGYAQAQITRKGE